MTARRLWIALGVVLVGSFAVLGGVGYEVLQGAPPIPTAVVTPDGHVLFDGASIRNGQAVWQSLGGQEIGSIWGHGAYVAPDWTADWLHREAVARLDGWARAEGGVDYAHLPAERQAALRARLQGAERANHYDPATGRVVVAPDRAAIFGALAAHYADVFANGREAYAIPAGTLTDASRARDLGAFFWWTAWAATTTRPGTAVTYTNNWPHDALVGNQPTSSSVLWSILSVVLLLAAIGGMVWYHGAQPRTPVGNDRPLRDPLATAALTPSQRATIKYFYVAAALMLLQVALGGITAHYGVEGTKFYGVPLAKVLPYAITRTWHLQLAIFWIATTWLATGLFIAPTVGGSEPRGQRLGVNLLFGALVLVVVGSLAGEWLSVQQKLGNYWFWFGHQGYEYVDLGRFWQLLLFIGMSFWLWLMVRALLPALRRRDEARPLLLLFVAAAVAIPLFYAAGLMYGQRAHLVTAEYWRWWVVHLWVEGFFEVFATVVIAFLFVRLKLLSVQTATTSLLFSTSVFLAGGIIGTFHHLYFTGTPNVVLGLGSTFSALEVVPLTLVGLEAWENIRLARAHDWLGKYRWPIYFFVAVAFWNFVGAGLFGFLINTPIALYYMQGLNTTPVHGHTALFGVYGLLGIGLLLFCLRAVKPALRWNERTLAAAFWMLNGGLTLMVLLSMLPIGLLQAQAAIEHGTWYARSAELLHSGPFGTLRWMRALGDSVFALGVLALARFLVGLLTGSSYQTSAVPTPITGREESAANG